MSQHSEYSDHNPNWGMKRIKHSVKCYRDGCKTFVAVHLLTGDRPTKWKQCHACGVKADNGYFDSAWAL